MEASSHGLDQHRLDGVRVAAGGFTNLVARPYGLSPDASRPISPPSCGCSSDLIAPGGAAVIDADNEHAERGDRRRAGARACGCSRSGGTGDGIRLIDARDRRLLADAAARARRQAHIACGCRWSARSRSRTRWSRPGWRSRPAAMPAAVFAALEDARTARKGRLELVGAAQRRADLRRLRAQARRARQGARRAAPLCASASSSSCSAPAATATRASGR